MSLIMSLLREGYSSNISSKDSPAASNSNTSLTRILVPLKIGFPWQISGSATIHPGQTLLHQLGAHNHIRGTQYNPQYARHQYRIRHLLQYFSCLPDCLYVFFILACQGLHHFLLQWGLLLRGSKGHPFKFMLITSSYMWKIAL